MKTETEARKCWCPFARVMGSKYANQDDADMQAATGNRGADFHGNSLCIASECMAWRWEGLNGYNEPYIRAGTGAMLGYCGLGGRPNKP